jgi:hypothetical protein
VNKSLPSSIRGAIAVVGRRIAPAPTHVQAGAGVEEPAADAARIWKQERDFAMENAPSPRARRFMRGGE